MRTFEFNLNVGKNQVLKFKTRASTEAEARAKAEAFAEGLCAHGHRARDGQILLKRVLA